MAKLYSIIRRKRGVDKRPKLCYVIDEVDGKKITADKDQALKQIEGLKQLWSADYEYILIEFEGD